MAGSGKIPIGRLIKRYAAVVVFPTVAASTIYLDWNYTRKWKLAQAEKQEQIGGELRQ